MRESTSGLRLNADYSVALNDMNSVPLKGGSRLFLVAGQTVRFASHDDAPRGERIAVSPRSYVYGLTLGHDFEERELLTFHWKDVGHGLPTVPEGHLHIGSALLGSPTMIRPGDFHHAHVPTGWITFADVVRFAIVELDVTPLIEDWHEVLLNAQALLQHQQWAGNEWWSDFCVHDSPVDATVARVHEMQESA